MIAPASFDAQEVRDPASRLADQLASLLACLAKAITIPGWREHLGPVLATLPGIMRARLVIGRGNDRDQLTLRLAQAGDGSDLAALASASRAITKLDTAVERVAPGTLPRDGVVIEDRRSV